MGHGAWGIGHGGMGMGHGGMGMGQGAVLLACAWGCAARLQVQHRQGDRLPEGGLALENLPGM